eukprot:CAMPEP_0174704518 /NCGR_PEP_ID=MMETSP1094-20130205/8083_1 /TAXON_ID=156173 /ORGANISM="Chrysochromulina brevifilum, Strain UTEX LB 985" /LENGTH=52 /DNA_ID=CAMNT_0015902583 /DNA_START=137 /DNA_END=292 /DNA_ORIENTATION=-
MEKRACCTDASPASFSLALVGDPSAAPPRRGQPTPLSTGRAMPSAALGGLGA